MSADSFLDLLKNDTSADEKRKIFYLSEILFYLDEAVNKLYRMMFKLKGVFGEGKIPVTRLESILDLIVNIEKETERLMPIAVFSDNEKDKLNSVSVRTGKLDDFLQKAAEDLIIDVGKFRN
jgi:hypothetical protein